MAILIIFICHWYISLFVQTFFLHRYASHQMFKMKPMTEKVFFIITWLAQGSSFLHPAAYALMHRKHHEHSDTEKDPHSPVSFKSWLKFMYQTADEYSTFIKKVNNRQYKDKSLPRWELIEKMGDTHTSRISFGVFYFLLYLYFAPTYWLLLLVPIHILMGPIHGFIVNWFGHKHGYRNFKKLHDNSKNTLFIDFLMLGELYQNNHHKFPTKSNFAFRWFEIDFGYFVIKLLDKLRIIRLLR
ncbi:acyl-CoA desaturase [Candidatus Marinimicrobia bacterium]|nr:acyl-CoA desaturase [Candidatus Neomarinimicrobiota bacterium]